MGGRSKDSGLPLPQGDYWGIPAQDFPGQFPVYDSSDYFPGQFPMYDSSDYFLVKTSLTASEAAQLADLCIKELQTEVKGLEVELNILS